MGKNLKSDAYEGGLTVDPSILPGVAATVGAIFLRVGTTEVWQKFGAADTDWERIVPALELQDDAVPVPGSPHDTLNFIGAGVQVTDAGGGVATVKVAGQNLVFRPGGVQGGNVYTSWTNLMAAKALIEGFKTIQFDDSIVSPCVIPPGVWDMTEVEWFGFWKPQGVGFGFFNFVTISDGASFTNLRKIGGDIQVTNLNNATAPVVINPLLPNNRVIFEIGAGFQSDFPRIINNGLAPFFDCTALVAGQLFAIRGQCQISGTSPAIQYGASPAILAFTMFEMRVYTGMIAGTNPAAVMRLFLGMSGMNRQSAWAGTIFLGSPSTEVGSTTGGTPYVRTMLFPASQNQLPAAPSAVPFTLATGLGMNTTLRFNAAAGVIAQTLPLIRAVAPAIGLSDNVVGTLDSTGMIVIVKETSGLFGVSVSRDLTTPDTIEGGAGPIVVPAGGSRIFQSDGISDWRVIAGYL